MAVFILSAACSVSIRNNYLMTGLCGTRSVSYPTSSIMSEAVIKHALASSQMVECYPRLEATVKCE